MNFACVIGNLGKDPELKHTQSGKAVCTLTVATSEQEGEKEHTEWHDVVVWEKRAEACAKYLTKGSKVGVRGRIRTRSWESNNQKHYRKEIIAQEVEFLSAPKEGAKNNAAPAAATGGGQYDDIPF